MPTFGEAKCLKSMPTFGGAKCSKSVPTFGGAKCSKSLPTFGEAKCLKKGSVPLRKNKPATMMVAGLEVCQSVNAYFFGKMIW